MKISELLDDPERRRFKAVPEMDALVEDDALQEAQLLEVRFDALRSAAVLLFDCRGAIQIQAGNTALITVAGVRRFSWTGSPEWRHTAWTAMGSRPSVDGGRWRIRIGFAPSATLEIEGVSAEFFVGSVPGCDAAPPDYGQDDYQTIRDGIANLESEFDIEHATFWDPRN